MPDQATQRNSFQWGIPVLGSMLMAHSPTGVVPGLKNMPPARQPNMALTFYCFRLMFLTEVLLFAVTATSVGLRSTGKRYTQRWFLRLAGAQVFGTGASIV